MWEFDCEENWALKNWCFWTVLLEKTLASPLDCKEIQPVHPKGDQSWVFTERTDAEAETPILWPPHAKSWLIGKDPDAGRHWGQEDKGVTEDEMTGWHPRPNAHEFGWTLGVGNGQGGLVCCDSWGRKSQTRLSDLNELNWIIEQQYFPNNVELFFFFFFSCSCWPSMSSLDKCLFRSAHFSLWVACFFFVFFFFLSCMSFYMFWVLTSYWVYIFADIFSHSVYCIFCFIDGSLLCEEASYFDGVPFVYFCFCFPCLRRHIQKEVAKTKENTAYVFFYGFYGFQYFIIFLNLVWVDFCVWCEIVV